MVKMIKIYLGVRHRVVYQATTLRSQMVFHTFTVACVSFGANVGEKMLVLMVKKVNIDGKNDQK